MLKEALTILKSGGVIAFPTETVYGIGALIGSRRGINKVYKLKKRPKNKPLQVLVSSLAEARKLAKFSPQALSCAKKSWPGPLTLVLPTLKGKKTIGIRIPKHPLTLKLLRKTGPLAATSANESGEKPALTALEVVASLPTLDLVIDGGKAKKGKASRVIDLTGKKKIILRT
ncbi:threonylcarbamoyl-AMP synthase [candidate division WOR-1 bacterium RIFOXYA12_FULL_52_29]|uniref:L-threonylcarbamoyladenylate synthase n=1 Tax=candidate division WOR-1 bacterium RIFOXYC12_FULL_54_18 TaxID=1802584 RepID=A0A1F4T5U4_UNCSA|nr:MAG: threonylcarbamoyl-AMP synthase [candidate division WOR-1 bacterium RIFOXYA2_FULL_51_19]OGC17026.1 MAG: threonylcarbamoyl-AMP synthase [candidate division WOR-1 bacterium RIFOXYA12_FULL_52_29]OGC25887.1 MAG: threonylcarbamoyl-AMP synthase [candidate division WOR-1 bacterium RIFOXYB2_FULL_45_9]OGC27443.1 MAG: threonylcarbamoyl-AMP synthase [candidate division WOR-1 bacterium RIFOXYC12_FULL_54_18]OGC29344.1 MAG: threonylcarbamoyl-AMP synthase [candidate division WOR-1 bacterium RIFOXYB12_F